VAGKEQKEKKIQCDGWMGPEASGDHIFNSLDCFSRRCNFVEIEIEIPL
jgi:hypothetical protein